jgi:hypothetical protein
MRRNHSAVLTLIAVPLLLLMSDGARTLAQAADKPPPPPQPAWVDEYGKVNLDKVPKEAPMIGSDGKFLKDAGGSDKMIRTYMGEVPPPPIR